MSPATSPTPAPTTVTAEDVDLGTGTLALVRLVPPGGRPPTLGVHTLEALRATLAEVAARAHAGELVAVALTGTTDAFAAGADLDVVATVTDAADARRIAEAGHAVVAALGDLPVPTFALVGGLALGGGLELALACTYRAAAADVRALGLPETQLGLVPGWGGCSLLPRLLGPEAALQVIIDQPPRRALLDAQGALELGLVDTVQRPGEDFLPGALTWVVEVLTGAIEPPRPDRTADAAAWDAAVAARRGAADRRAAGGAPAAARALALVEAARTATRAEAFAAEDDALVELIMSDQLRAGLYAQRLTRRRAKAPTGAPAAELARPVRRIGVIGAGLMASQLALLLASRLRVPVTMRDLDADRAEAGLAAVRAGAAGLARSGRLTPADAEAVVARVHATTDLADLADADLVIEAVFEELDVKRAVFAEVEGVVRPDCILATNTSALSVTAMADALAHPARLVGLHFFNPVAQMPLVEVVRAPRTDDAAYATAFAVAAACRKTAVAVADAPGFVVNRLLVRLLGEVLGACEEGTSLADAERALAPMGLPMGPFPLLQLVGPAVAAHVLHTLRAELGDRYPTSPGLDRLVADGEPLVAFEGRPSASSRVRPEIAGYFGSRPLAEPLDADGVLRRVQEALAQEAGALLADGVVAGPEDVDVAMILGAGWPLHNGGLTPYLDRSGASERVLGRRFLAPGVASLPAAG
ncbi:3-hydroxyacyl-CoA dehydrogenase NAD-binding domain-containing protein [Georgenia faecalis]|uniref:3-hydroxyacyl-CoA dehydrogenase NAD-binding domain-containing protein n=1 Tax=Georgenia faecalis TaxID=2483799 RepID=UPI000FD75CDC|nr:3-hydroxyacyl-CoA dehydrogenase NAD-binding domain-containing protein [Georgenia faecalis]